MEKYFDSQFERILSLTVRKVSMVDDYMVEGTDSWYLTSLYLAEV